jgi:hypothetical protein
LNLKSGLFPKWNVAELELADKHGGRLDNAGPNVVKVRVIRILLTACNKIKKRILEDDFDNAGPNVVKVLVIRNRR